MRRWSAQSVLALSNSGVVAMPVVADCYTCPCIRIDGS